MSPRKEKSILNAIAGSRNNAPFGAFKHYSEVGAGTAEEGETCVGDVDGTVVVAPLCVGTATEGTGTSVRS